MTDQTTETKQSDTPTKKRKHWFRRHIWWWLPLVVIVVVVALLPTLLSTSLGRRIIIGQVNQRIAGRAEVGGLSLSWFGGQSVRDVHLYAPDGTTVMQVRDIAAGDVSLVGVIFGQKDFGKVALSDLDLTVVQDEQGQTNLAKALASPTADKDKEEDDKDKTKDTSPPSWAAMSAQLELNGRVSYASPTIDTTTVEGITLAVRLDRGNLAADFVGRVKQAAYEGAATATVQVSDLVAVANSPATATQYATGTVKLDGFPTAWIDQLAGTDGKLLALFGSTVTLDIHAARGDGAGKDVAIPVTLAVDSDAVKLTGKLVTGATGVRTVEPIKATWRVEPARWSQVTQAFKLPDNGQLTEAASITAEISKLNVVTKQSAGATTLDWRNIELTLAVRTTPLALTLADGIGKVALSDTAVDVVIAPAAGISASVSGVAQRGSEVGKYAITAQLDNALTDAGPDWKQATGNVRADVTALPMDVFDQLLPLDGMLALGIGDRLDARIALDVVQPAGDGMPGGQLTAVVTSPRLTVDGAFDVTSNRVAATRPAAVSWTVVPALVSQAYKTFEMTDRGQLLAPVTLKVDMPTLDATTKLVDARTSLDWTALRLNMTVRSTPLRMAMWEDIGHVGLTDAVVTLNVSPKDGVSASINGSASRGDESGRFNIRTNLRNVLTVTGPDWQQATGEVEVDLTAMPLVVLDQLLPLDGLLVIALGEKLDAKIGLDITQPIENNKPTGRLRTSITAQRLKLAGEFDVNAGAFTATSPVSLTAQATPALVDRLKAMMKFEPDAKLARVSTVAPVTVGVELNLLAFVMPEGEATWGDAGKAASLAGAVTLSPTTVRVEPADAAGIATSHQTGKVRADVTYDGSIADRPLTLNATAEDVPSAMLDNLADQHGRVVAILGDQTNVTARASLLAEKGGDVDLLMRSTNTNVTMLGRVDAQNNLTLRSDATADLNATPALSEAFLSALNPLLREVVSGEQPIRLTLDAKAFRMPLKEFDITKLQTDGLLKLGTLKMQRGRIGGAIVQLLRAVGSNISDRERFDADFTDMTFTLRDGELRSSDLWYSTGDLVMGTQARVKLTPGKETGAWQAGLLIALPGRTIALIPGLEDLFGPTDVIELPVSGSVAGIKPDLAAFSGKILEYQAHARLAEKLGPTGKTMMKGLSVALRSGLQQDATREWRGAKWSNQPPPPAKPDKVTAPATTEEATVGEVITTPPASTTEPPAEVKKPAEEKPKEDVKPKPDLTNVEPTVEGGLNLLQQILEARKKEKEAEKEKEKEKKKNKQDTGS